jgi:hypothetical protein
MTLLVLLVSTRAARQAELDRQAKEDDRLEKSRHDLRVQRAQDKREQLADLRQAPYVECYQELRRTSVEVHETGYGFGTLPFTWNLRAYESVLRLEIFAEWETRVAANAAYSALYRWGEAGPFDYESDEEIAFQAANEAFLIAIRHDLRIEVDENRLSQADIIR